MIYPLRFKRQLNRPIAKHATAVVGSATARRGAHVDLLPRGVAAPWTQARRIQSSRVSRPPLQLLRIPPPALAPGHGGGSLRNAWVPSRLGARPRPRPPLTPSESADESSLSARSVSFPADFPGDSRFPRSSRFPGDAAPSPIGHLEASPVVCFFSTTFRFEAPLFRSARQDSRIRRSPSSVDLSLRSPDVPSGH